MNLPQLLFASIIFMVAFYGIVHAQNIFEVVKIIGMLICVWYMQNTVAMIAKKAKENENEKNIGYRVSR